MRTGTGPFIKHERHIRDKILQGAWTLRDCAVHSNDKLFHDEVEERLRLKFEQRMKRLEGSVKEADVNENLGEIPPH
jgi:hypothetical protein